jgi:hypothetical protein
MSTQFTNAVNAAIDTVASSYNLTYGTGASAVASAKAGVSEAVAEQVASAVESIRSAAQSEGLSESLVENVLIEAGLVDAPEPEVEVEPETLEQKVDRLLVKQGEQGAAIAALIAAAKANGINPDNYAA